MQGGLTRGALLFCCASRLRSSGGDAGGAAPGGSAALVDRTLRQLRSACNLGRDLGATVMLVGHLNLLHLGRLLGRDVEGTALAVRCVFALRSGRDGVA